MRAAIIGAGGIARVHARLIRELGGEVVGICGRTLASATAFGIGQPYELPRRMLNEQKPDVVHICSPNYLHAEHAIASFAAGAHVLCEKPMATSVDEGSRMVDAAARAGKVGAIAYTYRGYPLVEILRSKVASGAFGRLRRLSGCYLSQDVMAPDKYVWLFSPGTTGEFYVLMDLGIHWLDLAEYVSGERIAEITANFSTHQKTRTWRGAAGEGPAPAGTPQADGSIVIHNPLEEQADLLLRFENGAAGCVTVSGVSPGHPNTIILSADGPDGGFDWNQQEPNTFIERGLNRRTVHERSPELLPAQRSWMSMLPAGHAEGYVDAFRNVVHQAWSAMRGESQSYPSFADGMRGLVLVQAAVESARSRRPVATL